MRDVALVSGACPEEEIEMFIDECSVVTSIGFVNYVYFVRFENIYTILQIWF